LNRDLFGLDLAVAFPTRGLMASDTNSRFILITQPPAEETPNPLGGNGEHRNEGRRLDELASVDMSATEDETISDAEVFADAVSCQSSDDELF
jgi:hypothetical protein